MYELLFLLLFPLLTAILVLMIRHKTLRGVIVKISSILIIGVSIWFAVLHFADTAKFFSADYPYVNQVIFGLEMLMALFIFVVGIKHKKFLASILILVQAGAIAFFEIKNGHKLIVEYNLFIDKFSIIMALIIGVVGSLICIYAVRYMKDFHHHHPEFKDKQSSFFFVIFLFISAMFGVVFSNNLLWLYFFWEVTTLCSFLLIGYKKDKVSINNAFRAIILNLIGGLGFAAAIIYSYYNSGIIELDKLLLSEKSVVLIPAVLICFAGLAKSAQLPFSPWLTGAMVAPTPVSALLHSSTMVKAGVYIIIKFAPVLQGTWAGFLIALIGGFTFLITSLLAISQSDAKKVLAYSTIANLGLIVACGGIGSYEAVWAAIFLIIFHAVAKCLLFLCVGSVEHQIESRNIEDMTGLITRMPKTAAIMLIGMAGMFLAPFGMLVSKWAVIRAFADQHTLILVLIMFGSSATLFFWVKWMGKLLIILKDDGFHEKGIGREIWEALYPLAALTVILSFSFPLISIYFVEPYIRSIYNTMGGYGILSQGNIILMLIMMGLFLLIPFAVPRKNSKSKYVIKPAYLAGANVGSNDKFTGSLGSVQDVKMSNYYLEEYFGEAKLLKLGIITAIVIILAMITVIFI